MSHFAHINSQNIVDQVIVAEQDYIDTLEDKTSWVQTSYNTRAGQHPEGRPLRKNYAGIGFTYDAQRDAFIPPQPYPSWNVNEETCLWDPPTPYPTDGKIYGWDEATVSWIQINEETP